MPLHRAAPYLEKTFECRNASSTMPVRHRHLYGYASAGVFFLLFEKKKITYIIGIGIAELLLARIIL